MGVCALERAARSSRIYKKKPPPLFNFGSSVCTKPWGHRTRKDLSLVGLLRRCSSPAPPLWPLSLRMGCHSGPRAAAHFRGAPVTSAGVSGRTRRLNLFPLGTGLRVHLLSPQPTGSRRLMLESQQTSLLCPSGRLLHRLCSDTTATKPKLVPSGSSSRNWLSARPAKEARTRPGLPWLVICGQSSQMG